MRSYFKLFEFWITESIIEYFKVVSFFGKSKIYFTEKNDNRTTWQQTMIKIIIGRTISSVAIFALLRQKVRNFTSRQLLAKLTFAYLAPTFTVKVSVVIDFDYWSVSFSNSFRFYSDFLFYYEKIRFSTKVFTYNICMYVDNILTILQHTPAVQVIFMILSLIFLNQFHNIPTWTNLFGIV